MLVKRKFIIFVSSFTFFVMLGFFLQENMMLRNSTNEKNDMSEVLKQERTLSMMVEQTAGAGDYEVVTRSSWPTSSEGYIFNSALSKCENGGELGWDDEKGVVTMTGNMSDKCYVYFDVAQKAVINEITTSDITTTSMTITIDSSKGTFDISKYYYSIDDGTTWNESTSNVISISGLTIGTEYSIKAYVQDSKGIISEYKSISIEKFGTISFTIADYKNIVTTYYAEEGMTWGEWLNSSYCTGYCTGYFYASGSYVSGPGSLVSCSQGYALLANKIINGDSCSWNMMG